MNFFQMKDIHSCTIMTTITVIAILLVGTFELWNNFGTTLEQQNLLNIQVQQHNLHHIPLITSSNHQVHTGLPSSFVFLPVLP